MKNNFQLLACILLCHLAGIIGSFFTITGVDSWYAALEKPFLQPPNWVFAPVWLTLYTLMGISLYWFWKGQKPGYNKYWGYGVFAVQLLLNALWSYVFFGLQMILQGILVITLLWVAILFSMVAFYPVTKKGSLLLLPYLLWVSFATYLNIAITYVNIFL